MSYFKKENLLFYAFNVVYFACSSLYFGFIVMYLTAHGYSSFECGVINTIISLDVYKRQLQCRTLSRPGFTG